VNSDEVAPPAVGANPQGAPQTSQPR
jgi:hypothetical protein